MAVEVRSLKDTLKIIKILRDFKIYMIKGASKSLHSTYNTYLLKN